MAGGENICEIHALFGELKRQREVNNYHRQKEL